MPVDGYASPKCESPGKCGEGTIEASCNNNQDCSGNQICCGRFSYNENVYIKISCASSCQNSRSSMGVKMCHDDPGACQQWEQCKPSMVLPPGYSYCD